jgi:hypothetical protein
MKASELSTGQEFRIHNGKDRWKVISPGKDWIGAVQIDDEGRTTAEDGNVLCTKIHPDTRVVLVDAGPVRYYRVDRGDEVVWGPKKDGYVQEYVVRNKALGNVKWCAGTSEDAPGAEAMAFAHSLLQALL